MTDSPALDTLRSHCIVLHIWIEVALWWIHAWRRVRFLIAAEMFFLVIRLLGDTGIFPRSAMEYIIRNESLLMCAFWSVSLSICYGLDWQPGWGSWNLASNFLHCSRSCSTLCCSESAELAEVEAHLEAEDKRDDDATSKSQKVSHGSTLA